MIFVSDFNQTWISSTNCNKILQHKISQNSSLGNPVLDRWTDMMQQIGVFYNLVNTPGNDCCKMNSTTCNTVFWWCGMSVSWRLRYCVCSIRMHFLNLRMCQTYHISTPRTSACMVQVKLSLCLIEHNAMRACGECSFVPWLLTPRYSDYGTC